MVKAPRFCLFFFAIGGLWIVSSQADESARPAVLSPAWELGAREDLAAKEYWITWQDRTQLKDDAAAWHAPNRVQGFRTYFTPEGIRSVPRTGREPGWSWGLSLAAYGRGSISHVVEQARLFPDENRIRLDHREIDEWFVNEPRGLKHGFVLHAPPAESQESTDPVHVELRVSGSLTPVLDADGQSVRFVASSGLGLVYYNGLEVHDALGRALPAWMETSVTSGVWMIRLLVDDREAAYPIEIDPLATTAAWFGEGDQAGAAFGRSVSTAGDVNADGYDDLIVGVAGYDNGQANEGAAFLYLGSAEEPYLTYDWMVEGDEADAYAGLSVSNAGDVNGDGYDDVIVGLPYLDSGDGAWVFHGSPFGLSLEPDWIGQGGPADKYGYSVDTAGDVNNDGYDDVIVGAYLYGSSPWQEGRVYLYHGSASGLLPGPAWTAEGGQDATGFGHSVGTAGDINGDGYDDVVVGAWYFSNGEWQEGRAYVWHGSELGLSTQPDWIYENNDEQACLGVSVGTAGDVNNDGYDDVLIGAAYQSCTDSPTSPVGKVHVFHGSDSGLASEPDSIRQLTQTGSAFGIFVATAGDVNGDAYDDAVVGAIRFDNDQLDEGAAFLYLGSEVGLSDEHVWREEGDQVEARLGMVNNAGDVNGDGYDDVIVGARKYDNGEIDEGRAYLYLGAAGSVVPAGSVPTDAPLLLGKAVGGALQLTWGPSCLDGDVDYEIYEGRLGEFTSHAPRSCSTGGQTTNTFFVLNPEDLYYLVVPSSPSAEGSYGTTSDAFERPPGTVACLPQLVGGCE